ncbi:type VI secretion system baseplate subunit TssF [Derxia gummosa]|uniref:Type VI secretion system baseplate subunit TssF n=1 Tax=Derxia gummosa DSM 723 TaxID=1121388 RepID=A0A8B6X304_9BURK|nr:type VI secretion system baseplate subunit TssF [Derxia gummosa]
MDPRLLDCYENELKHLREMGAEFARQHPKIAARLDIASTQVADPYVERLLEGFAFMAARVQLRLDAEFPRFTQRLLEVLHPGHLAPQPAALIAELHPRLGDAALVSGFRVPRGTGLRGLLGRGDATACQFRTAHELRLWPLKVESAAYVGYVADLPLTQLPLPKRPRATVRVKLRVTGGHSLRQLPLDRLVFHLGGQDGIAARLYERLFTSLAGVLVNLPGEPLGAPRFLGVEALAQVGFEDSEALLPVGLRNFQGWRLVQEYFALPQRYHFIALDGLDRVAGGAGGGEVEFVFLLDQPDSQLEGVIAAENFRLNCTPAVNLFEQRCDRIHLDGRSADHHVVPDRTRPMDLEVVQVTNVVGHGPGGERVFHPLYAAFHADADRRNACYSLLREPRALSAGQKRNGSRSSYVGSEVFISLVDPDEAPYPSDLRQLSVTALCSNRDLPLHMAVGVGATDLVLDVSAPVEGVRVVKGPSRPASALREGGIGWRFINHLSLNYLSLLDADEHEGASIVRDMLALHAVGADDGTLRQIEGLRAVRARPVTRRLPPPAGFPGGAHRGHERITFGRGIEIELEVDEMSFQGASAFLLSAVLARFFARHASINSFTETTLRSLGRGEIMRWRPRCGTRALV